MNKDEIILMLQQLVASLQQQLADSNRKVDVLLQEVAELTFQHRSFHGQEGFRGLQAASAP